MMQVVNVVLRSTTAPAKQLSTLGPGKLQDLGLSMLSASIPVFFFFEKTPLLLTVDDHGK